MKNLPSHVSVDTGGQRETLAVEAVLCNATNKLYYQIRPYIRDGKLYVKRLAVLDVKIEKYLPIIEGDK